MAVLVSAFSNVKSSHFILTEPQGALKAFVDKHLLQALLIRAFHDKNGKMVGACWIHKCTIKWPKFRADAKRQFVWSRIYWAFIYTIHLQPLWFDHHTKPCQLNQRSPAQISDFVNIFSVERQTYMINAKILNYTYWVVHYFVEGGQNDNFHLRFGTKLEGCKNYFRKMAASWFYFYKEIVRSISKTCWLFSIAKVNRFY